MKLSRILYQFVAGMFILIGLLHLQVHYAELVSPELQKALGFDISLMGNNADVYKMWQGFSFMMGVCFIIIGLLNLVFIRGIGKENFPPVGAIIVMMLLMSAVTYSGANFFGPEQFYGGIFALICLSISLVLNLKHAR